MFPFWQENVEEGGFEIFGVFENSNRSASSGAIVVSWFRFVVLFFLGGGWVVFLFICLFLVLVFFF